MLTLSWVWCQEKGHEVLSVWVAQQRGYKVPKVPWILARNLRDRTHGNLRITFQFYRKNGGVQKSFHLWKSLTSQAKSKSHYFKSWLDTGWHTITWPKLTWHSICNIILCHSYLKSAKLTLNQKCEIIKTAGSFIGFLHHTVISFCL